MPMLNEQEASDLTHVLEQRVYVKLVDLMNGGKFTRDKLREILSTGIADYLDDPSLGTKGGTPLEAGEAGLHDLRELESIVGRACEFVPADGPDVDDSIEFEGGGAIGLTLDGTYMASLELPSGAFSFFPVRATAKLAAQDLKAKLDNLAKAQSARS